ncbi:hypothetical protein CHS0354_027382 [Potamilus streckersoni]|uniref:Superoxide dismutase n=1 Tax=Potamilus streckersoni TaxID=2493646 RepID=A0AAE0SQD1_9BIVA|nr:hypothetical protein CHS0354_027382 [Potamilus streckersoni]
MAFEFKNLPYAYDALEPHIDAKTMEIHHSKHHKTYFDKFTDAVKGTPAENQPLEQVLKELDASKGPVRNNGGGFYNHNLFWLCMSPAGNRTPSGKLGDAVNQTFGSYDNLKQKINDAGVGRFGSGFVWLISNSAGTLEDNPLMPFAEKRGTPVFCVDVWEHAYYLKFQNRRPEYLNSFWNVASWKHAEEIYARIAH